jgi:hypothetical protein
VAARKRGEAKDGLASGVWSRVAPFIVLTAEVSGLVTFVGALFSVVFNSIAFSSMGLSFVDIATPSDLLMSGIKLAGTFLIVLAVSLGLSLPIYLVLRRLRRVPDRVWKWAFAITGTVCAAAAAWEALSVAELAGGSRGIGAWFEILLLAYFPLLALAMLVSGAQFERPWRFAAYAALAVALTLVFSISVYSKYWRGYTNDNLYVAYQDGDDRCDGELRAAWIGSSSIVAECGAGFDGRDIRVINRSSVNVMTEAAYRHNEREALYASHRQYDPSRQRDWRHLGDGLYYDKGRSGDGKKIAAFVDILDVERRGKMASLWLGIVDPGPDSSGGIVIDIAVDCDANKSSKRAAYLFKNGSPGAMRGDEYILDDFDLPLNVARAACWGQLQALERRAFHVAGPTPLVDNSQIGSRSGGL